MKIAIFTETYMPYINGVVTHIKLLKEGLEKQGHKVLIVTADPSARHHYIQNGVLHCPARSSKRLYGYGLAVPISHKRMQMIKDYNPDIIHIHQEFGIGLFGAMAAKHLHKPLVYTLHTMYDEYLYYIAPDKLIPALRKTSHQYARFLARRASAITGPSKKVEEFFRACGVQKNINIIPNPVELDSFAPEKTTPQQCAVLREELKIPADAHIVSFCGRLGKEKSVDVLLKYWKESIAPEENIYLVIIGDGPACEELVSMARKYGIDKKVIFTGKVEHEKLPPYYAISDMYVTASLSDTNSISMLEAMASGLPVIHRLDPLNEGQVQEGVNGYIYTDAQSMAKYIHKICNMTPEEKNILKHSVRNSVKSSGAENLANYLLTIYQNIPSDTNSHPWHNLKDFSGKIKFKSK